MKIKLRTFLKLFLVLWPTSVFAQGILPTNNEPAKYQFTDFISFLGNVMRLAIGLVGGVAVIFIIYGGYKYMMAGGNPEQAAGAKSTILWAIVGLIIAITSYIVVAYIWGKFARVPIPGF